MYCKKTSKRTVNALVKQVEDFLVRLNDTDRLLLSSYCSLCDCLSQYLGTAYEIVVHSLGVGDKFIQRIVNGVRSGRSEEDNIDQLSVTVIEQLSALVKQDDKPIIINFSTGKNGGMLKSASIGIVGKRKRLIGMICFNFYLDTPFSTIIEMFALPRFLISSDSSFSAYNGHDYDTALHETIRNIKDTVMYDQDIPAKFKRKEIIRKLNEIGFFNVKKGIILCAETLGITITTIYMHLRNMDATAQKSDNDN